MYNIIDDIYIYICTLVYLMVVDDAGFSSMAISWTVAGALWRCDIHGTVVFWLVVAGFMVTTEWFSRRFYYS